MNASAQGTFDIDGLKGAFAAGDIDGVLGFYSENLEHVEIDAGAPPKSPRTTDFEELGKKLRGGAADAGVKLSIDNTFVAGDRAACTITCALPDGRRLISNTIYDLEGGKIVRQLDVQVMDPQS
jgi:hypothetical protein